MIQNMGKLAAALAWAARGFRVFPLAPNSKDPPGFPWTEDATTDPEKIKMWWWDPVLEAERDHNIGCLTSNLIVADVDVKHGRDGLDTALSLDLDFETLTVRTPSQGFHLYYQPLPDRLTGQSPIAEGIDTRSFNGFVVAPGSTIDGVAYEVCEDLPLAPFPPHLAGRMKEPKARKAKSIEAIDFEMDTPEAIETAIEFLAREAPGIKEGGRGYGCYKLAAELWDRGISEELAVELLCTNWNPKNDPPMDRDHVAQQVNHGYRYVQNEMPGTKLASSQLSGINYIGPPTYVGDIDEPVYSPGEQSEENAEANEREIAEIMSQFKDLSGMTNAPKRQWIIESLLIPRNVTTLIADGGTGKSVFGLTLACHLALGKDFFGYRIIQPGKTVIYSAEDDREELMRRVTAICIAYGFDFSVCERSIIVITGEERRLQFVRAGKPDNQHIMNHINAVSRVAQREDVRLLIVDPIANVHNVNENDQADVNMVMDTFRSIAHFADVAVLAVHHTGKLNNRSTAELSGSSSAARGSSAIPNASRVVLTMFRISPDDRAELRIPPTDTTRYIKLEGAKANFSAGWHGPVWLKFRTIEVPCGEPIGVLERHNAHDSRAASKIQMAHVLADFLRKSGEASCTLTSAAEALRRLDPFHAVYDIGTLKTRIAHEIGGTPVAVGGGAYLTFHDKLLHFTFDIEPIKVNPP